METFLVVYLKFAWFKASKNSTSCISSRKTFTKRRHFRTFLVIWRHTRWFAVVFWAKNNKRCLFLRLIRQILDVTYDTPKKTFPHVFAGGIISYSYALLTCMWKERNILFQSFKWIIFWHCQFSWSKISQRGNFAIFCAKTGPSNVNFPVSGAT